MNGYDFMAILDSHLQLFIEMESKSLDASESDKDEEGSKLLQMHDNIGIVNVNGGLTNTNSWINRFFNLISYDDIRAASFEALEKGAQAIMFNINSPGGKVSGLSDVANTISNLGVPTLAFTSEVMASAAYFLGSQADHLYADSFSEVGSIGVISMIANYVEAMKQAGVKVIRFRSGDLKAAGSPYFNLSDKEKKYMEDKVNLYAEKFFDVVSNARGIPRPLLDQLDITSGRTFIGEEAQKVGLVDGIITFDQAVAKTLQLAKKSIDKNSALKVMYN